MILSIFPLGLGNKFVLILGQFLSESSKSNPIGFNKDTKYGINRQLFHSELKLLHYAMSIGILAH